LSFAIGVLPAESLSRSLLAWQSAFYHHLTARMVDVPSSDPPALQHFLDHLLSRLSAHRIASESQAWARPLFVGIQGPQGSGKSFLTALAAARLSARSPPVHAAVLGLDDLYLPHAELVRVARAHPDNVLLQGRGQPGTHDIPLGTRVLRALTAINDAPAEGPKEVKLPTFDKSAHAGEGDRAPPEAFLAITAPLDVVLFEGWCVGFMPRDASEISARRVHPVPGLPVFDLGAFCAQDAVEVVSEYLAGYREWWAMLDAFVQVCRLTVLLDGAITLTRAARPGVRLARARLPLAHGAGARAQSAQRRARHVRRTGPPVRRDPTSLAYRAGPARMPTRAPAAGSSTATSRATYTLATACTIPARAGRAGGCGSSSTARGRL
jgi:D-glycerate 3-kinase